MTQTLKITPNWKRPCVSVPSKLDWALRDLVKELV